MGAIAERPEDDDKSNKSVNLSEEEDEEDKQMEEVIGDDLKAI